MIGNIPEVLNFYRLLLNLNRFTYNKWWILPIHGSDGQWWEWTQMDIPYHLDNI